ncbi:hypothetical protein F5X68DRAFT_152579 [Plectosphaerella plurivora]|uniref:DNA mismatch repair protein PMS1 n=1 Tax=Plectosphaerella plurivora TaxID=936078 RepID=A0A9P9AB03_9PEZI|nr:hypothetical protein F5X68DRAFT_152579 [Plectosphaerella plurivora]
MATIKPIEPATVHQIQSGQVIVDLCSVVKELVENCLDAGATTVDVRFKNQGLESIEVQDNGTGISPENYETLALKHYTSKLARFSDMDTLETFGFRGEALSSLCALSNLSITTCVAQDAPKATKLEFEPSGRLAQTSIIAGQKGTMVTVQNLFHNLPVRRRELERNIKREWNKAVTLLNQYACIQTGLKFTVSQQPSKGKRIVLFSTKGNPTTRENIINIFGTKTMGALLELDVHLEFQPTLASRAGQPSQENAQVHVKGFVSRPVQGDGRQTPDRQMLFVNSRPCLLPQFSKVFNEVYRIHNPSQSPFVLADIRLDTHLYDVNVSPDKRTILMHEQVCMLEELRAALVQLFELQDYSVPRSHLSTQATISHELSRAKSSSASTPPVTDSRISQVGDHQGSSLDRVEEDEPGRPPSDTQAKPIARRSTKRHVVASSSPAGRTGPPPNFLSRWMATSSENPGQSDNCLQDQMANTQPETAVELEAGLGTTQSAGVSSDEDSGDAQEDVDVDTHGDSSFTPDALRVVARRGFRGGSPDDLEHKVTHGVASLAGKAKRSQEANPYQDNEGADRVPIAKPIRLLLSHANSASHDDDGYPESQPEDLPRSRETSPMNYFSASNRQASAEASSSPQNSHSMAERGRRGSNSAGEEHTTPVVDTHSEDRQCPSTEPASPSRGRSPSMESSSIIQAEEQSSHETMVTPNVASVDLGQNRSQRAEKGKYATVHLSQRIELGAATMREAVAGMDVWEERRASDHHRQSLAKGLDADDAEETLSLIVTKADFAKMTLVGQFNLGFILAMRHATATDGQEDMPSSGDQLFIIDQHASDEKFNFERLQATTVLQSQRLVRPKRLDLTALEEEVVKENVAALEQNGFQVRIDESGAYPVGSRCELAALPLSRETTFSLDDLEELISLLGDETNTVANQVPRPSKVRKIFAMRACRSSIMIGRALTRHQMGTLVRHMGELDKPWNCPHGRPTMRHLCGLQDWDTKWWQEDDIGRKGTIWAEYSGENGK